MQRRVVFYTDGETFGGAERALLMLLSGLDRGRWAPILAHHPAIGIQPLVDAAGRLDVRLMPVPPMPLGLTGAPAAFVFARALHRGRPPVFHAHLSWQLAAKHALTAAVLARLPCVVATLHLFVDARPSVATLLQQAALSRRVNRYLAVSHHVARLACDRLRWPERRVSVVHNGVELERFTAGADASLRARLVGGRECALALVPARLTEQKGHRHLLRAAARLPGVVFALVGDGPERASLERTAREVGVRDRILFLGDRDDLPDLLAVCDVMVLPSLYEGLPLVVLEAMAASRPVVATAVGGTPEAVEPDGTGLLVPPADPQALASAVRRVVENPPWACMLGEAGRRRVEREFSSQAMIRAVTGHYEEILDHSGRAEAQRPAQAP